MGAKANPVVVITAADLESNGGQYKLVSKYAMKVSGNDALAAMGGTPMVVYPVSQAQIDSGEFELAQGHPVDVAQVTDRGQESSAWAMPVYHEGPGTWPGIPEAPGYYVDATAGNDANDGLSSSTPWQTLAKVSGSSFDVGDSVFLKRGETWNETLTPPTDGITIGAYGAGALPIIHGQDTRNYCINASARNNLTIEDLTLQDPLLTGLLFTSGTHTVNRVVSDGSNDQAFQTGGGLIDSNVTFNDCIASGAFDDGFSVHPGPGLGYLLTINNCTVTGCNEGLQDAGASAGTIVINGSTFNANVKDITISTLITLTVNRTMFKGMAGASHQSITGLGTINYSIFDMADSARVTQVAASGAGAILNLNNCTFYGWNGSQTNGGLIAASGATLNAVNCIFDRAWRIIRGGTGVANLNYCNPYNVTTVDVTTNTNTVSDNPLLTNPAADDFALSASSPAIGAGTTYAGQLATDYAGNPVASPPSLGALEYVP